MALGKVKNGRLGFASEPGNYCIHKMTERFFQCFISTFFLTPLSETSTKSKKLNTKMYLEDRLREHRAKTSEINKKLYYKLPNLLLVSPESKQYNIAMIVGYLLFQVPCR